MSNYSTFMQLLANRERVLVIYSIIHFKKICIVWIGLQRISFWLLWTSYCANETSWCLTVVAKLYTRLRTYFIIRETFQTYSLPVYPFLIHYLRLHALNDKSFISRFLTPILQNNKKVHCSISDLVVYINIFLNSYLVRKPTFCSK